MKIVLNEPHVKYKIAGWLTEMQGFSFVEYIYRIENETILYYPPCGSTFIEFPKRQKRKLSALRGKMTRQNENEIDDQISDLRSEWNRNT
nr:hypothetical protein [Bacteroidota bacterium]